MKRSKIFDATVFCAIILITSSFPWIVGGNFVNNSLNNPIFFALIVTVPAATFLGLRKKKNWKKIVAGSIVFGVLFGAILEFIAHITLAWQVPNTIFSFRILGQSTMEAFIGYIPMTLLVLVFYEHFFNEDLNHRISPHIWNAVIPALLAWLLIICLSIFDPQKLIFSQPYIKMGIAAVIPVTLQVIRRPSLISKYIKLACSMFFIFFLFEIVGVKFMYWVFPGHDYLGKVTYFGQTFPIEEIIFWMFLYPVTIVSYYERWVDDNR